MAELKRSGSIMRVFVTGATGFIGSHLVRRLVSEGYDVGILKRKNSDLSRIRDIINLLVVYEADMREYSELSSAIGDFKPNIILHLVTYYAVEHKPDEIEVMFDTNVKGTINILEAAKENSVKYFINTSTCAVYEDLGRELSERDNIKPQNLYALSKLQAEEACSFYSDNYGLSVVTLRLFPPYGPADNERRLLQYVIRCLLKDENPNLTTGKQRWDFVYVDDIVDAFIRAMNLVPNISGYEVFNIGTGNPVSIRDVVLKLKEITGSRSELNWGVVPHRKNEVWLNSADIRKSINLLGCYPQTNIDEGLLKTVSWIKYSDE